LGGYARAATRNFERKSYGGEPETSEVIATDGTLYQFEFLFYWHGEPEHNIRVIASVFHDPRGAASEEDFILSPDGSFVGE
jgi:hypothetical protein